MPPRGTSSGHLADPDKEDTSDKPPTKWKGDSMGFPPFWQDGLDTLFETVEGSQAYFEYGTYHQPGKRVSAVSISHGQAYLADTIPKGSLDVGSPKGPFEAMKVVQMRPMRCCCTSGRSSRNVHIDIQLDSGRSEGAMTPAWCWRRRLILHHCAAATALLKSGS